MERGPGTLNVSGLSPLGRRFVVAVVGLPTLAFLLMLPEELFLAAILLLVALAGAEIVRAAGADRGSALRAGVAAAVLAGGLFSARDIVGVMAAALTVLVLAAVLSAPRDDRPAWLWWVAGVLYVAVPATYLALLHAEPEAHRWLLVLLAGVFATDTAAYAVGRMLGRHRLVPQLSPRKTWEGMAGGFFVGVAVTLGTAWWLNLTSGNGAITGLELFVLVLALPVAAQAGDLLASAIKRRLGRKDFSTLLPGHGGLLDRMDSLLAAAPTLYWIVAWGT